MTNFERWKAKLTPQEVADYMSDLRAEECVDLCPAALYVKCPLLIGEELKDKTCSEYFLEWAESEVSE